MSYALSKLLSHRGDEISMSEIRKLAAATAVVPCTSVECERAFSKMNFMKTNLRNRMTTKTLNSLVLLQTHGPPLEKFPFKDVVAIWHRVKHRRIEFKTPVAPTATSTYTATSSVKDISWREPPAELHAMSLYSLSSSLRDSPALGQSLSSISAGAENERTEGVLEEL